MKIPSSVLSLSKNSLGRDYVVGDIHGHTTRLLDQLDEMGFDRRVDRLICTGDLIDRGPESGRAIDLLSQDWFFSVLGNHEYFMLSGLKYGNSKHKMMWFRNGGDWIATSTPSDWPRWFDLLSALPVAIEVELASGGKAGIIHADFPGYDWKQIKDFDQHQLELCLWSRSQFHQRRKDSVSGIDAIYHGHTVNGTANSELNSSEPVQLGNRFYIEPGAYLGAKFVIVAL
jgi:serine/threonine protein phosphatase 1